jgi:hypothetical protein
MKPKNPHKLAATRRKAGPHGDGARRPDPDERLRYIIDEWGPLLRRLGDNSGPVGDVCLDCQFEARAGHSPACSGEERGDE